MGLFDFEPEAEIEPEKFGAFQAEISAAEIKAIEEKFINPKLRESFSYHPARALTAAERETYARYLESKNQHKGAASFRNYSSELEQIQVAAEKEKQKQERKEERGKQTASHYFEEFG